MKTKDIITYAAIAAGAYGVYWYITHYGPQGAAMDASGNKIAPSWWDGWFGGAAAVNAAAPAGTTSTSTGTGTGTGTSAATPPASISIGGVSTDQLLAIAGLPATGKLNSSQWNYYYGKVSGVDQNAVYLADSGAPMTVFDYMTLRQSRGYLTPQAGNSAPAAAATVAAPSTTTISPATPDQIGRIVSLLKPSDVPAFETMVINGLSSQQAAAMIANAVGCQTKLNVPFQSPVISTNYDLSKNACVGPEMLAISKDPLPTGVSGLGVITPTRSEQATTASPRRNPWGRIASASADRAGMSWKN